MSALDLDDAVALVERAEPDWTTVARDITDIAVVETTHTAVLGARDPVLRHGRGHQPGRLLPAPARRSPARCSARSRSTCRPRQLRTRAVWWTVDRGRLERAGLATADVPGAAHAAEHASIGLLPLFATCDRWDIGGVSTALHPDTGRLTVFVYDGHPGGAGFAERGHAAPSPG